MVRPSSENSMHYRSMDMCEKPLCIILRILMHGPQAMAMPCHAYAVLINYSELQNLHSCFYLSHRAVILGENKSSKGRESETFQYLVVNHSLCKEQLRRRQRYTYCSLRLYNRGSYSMQLHHSTVLKQP